MSLTAWERSWRPSWMAFAFGSLHPPQHVAQQLRSRREVPLRVRDVCMTQIRAQLWQMTLDIHPATVPLQKCLDGQPVAQPMQARSMRITWSAQANLVREFDECPSQHVIRHVSSTVGEKEPGTVGAATQAISEFCVTLQRALCGGVHGDIPCLSKLTVSNLQHAAAQVHIVTLEVQGFVRAQTGGHVQPEERGERVRPQAGRGR